jgi:hypothetical protein
MQLNIAGPFNSGAAAGGAGVATSNQDTPIQLTGRVYGYYVKYNGAVPAATADVIITTKGVAPHMPTQTLLAVANSATGALYLTRKQATDAAAAVIAGVYDEVAIDDIVNIKIDQTDPTTSVDVWVMLEVGD